MPALTINRGIYMKNIKNKPLISVIMPVYNGSTYIADAINSILNQTYRHFELLIIDDGSTDNSWKIIQDYKQKFPNIIKAYKLKKNCGAFNAANFLIKYAKGKYLAPMDCDDISNPDRLLKQVKFLETFPEITVLGTQANIINDKGEFVGIKRVPLDHKQIYEEFGVFHPMVHPSCMIRRSALVNPNKLYNIKYGVNDDYYTFFSLLTKGKFANLDECLLNYRIHFKNSSLLNVKGKFLNSLKIRFEAVNNFGYKLSFKCLLLIIIQTIVVFPIPSKYILSLYLIVRGIHTPQNIFTKFVSKFDISFIRTKGSPSTLSRTV